MGAFEARRQSPLMSSLLWLLLGVAGGASGRPGRPAPQVKATLGLAKFT